jgi:hypothetical protein
MPCWTIQESKLEVKNLNQDVLTATLESLGYVVQRRGEQFYADHMKPGELRYTVVCMKDGEMVVQLRDGSRVTAERAMRQVKVAYGQTAIRTMAKRFGWQVKQEDETHFQVMRRY